MQKALITGINGIAISSGPSSFQSILTSTISASGSITSTIGIAISSGTSSFQSIQPQQ